MAIHHLKVWPRYYKALANGSKPFEVRRNDRGFAVDDTLVFHGWDPDTSTYIDRPLLFSKVLAIFSDVPGLIDGYVIMTISVVRQT